MSDWKIKTIRGVESLRAYQSVWDQLEGRSPDHQDMSYDSLRSFCKYFDAENRLVSSLVFDNEKLIAALPVASSRQLGVFAVARNLSNEWFPGRSGLLDPDYDATSCVRYLLKGLQQAGISSLELDWQNSESGFAKSLRDWAEQQSCAMNEVSKFSCGWIQLADSWDAFIGDWSKNRRKFIRRSEERLAAEGPLYTVCVHDRPIEDLDRYLETCLSIEDRSWKGKQQSSLLQNPGALKHYRELVHQWHRDGRLQLYILKSNGRPIAFDLGYLKNRIANSIKISYLDDYARFSPGHVLNAMVIREMIRAGNVDRIDTLGELNEANRKWAQSSYDCTKLEIALPGWINQSRVQIKDWMRTLKRTATANPKKSGVS